MADADETKPGEGGGDSGTGTAQDAEYWKAEAKKAFQARDELKGKIRELEGRSLSDDQRAEFERLQAERAKLDEAQKKAEGRYDELKASLVEKHQQELATERQRREAAERERDAELIEAAFYGAVDLFGHNGLTILPADVARAYFASAVSVEHEEGKRPRLIVKTPDGKTIHGDDGNPAPFSQAMAAYIKALPDERRGQLLRGSGKAGSGSSGGSGGLAWAGDDDLIKRVQDGDKDAIKELRKRQRDDGGVVMGSAFQKG
jgi:hypothetical protein